jgi:ATP-dependent RNA helicase DDX42
VPVRAACCSTVTPLATQVPADNEEEDPLDAFMRSMEQPASAPAPQQRAQAADDEYDPVTSYVEARGRQPLGAQRATHDDSDEDVYATAAALDAAQGDDVGRLEPRTADAAPLDDVDHDAVTYEDFARVLYTAAPEVARLTDAEVAQKRAACGIRVGGPDPPAPVDRFGQCGLPAQALLALKQRGFTAPTAVQASVLPAALSGRDVLVCAETGSGKTLAYLLPALLHASVQRPPSGPDEGPIVLVMVPTRELGQQVHGECARFGAAWQLTAVALLGGHDKGIQIQGLRGGAAVAVATPGRVMDMARGPKAHLKLHRVTCLVLDEADRLLSLGFEAAVRSVVRAVRPDAQTLLFSATLPSAVSSLAHDLLDEPVCIYLGTGGGNVHVRQACAVLPDDASRLAWVTAHVSEWVDAGQVLIFAGRITTVDVLVEALRNTAGVRARGMHGDKDQVERSATLSAFRSGECHVLVATDLAARGLDVKDLRTVVCFDPARDEETHTHRIGRTGRAGATDGVAISLLTRAEGGAARMLVRHMSAAFQPIPGELADLARSAHAGRGKKRPRGGGSSGAIGLGFAPAGGAPTGFTPAAAGGGFRGNFVPATDGGLSRQVAPEIVAPRNGWNPQPLPPPPPLPRPPQAQEPPGAAAARAAAAAIAARLMQAQGAKH